MRIDQSKYRQVILIVTGLALFIPCILLSVTNPSSYISGVVFGASLFLSGILFWFVKIKKEHREYASCCIIFGLVAIFVGLLLDPFFNTASLGFGVIVLIVGILFWLKEPEGKVRWWVP